MSDSEADFPICKLHHARGCEWCERAQAEYDAQDESECDCACEETIEQPEQPSAVTVHWMECAIGQ